MPNRRDQYQGYRFVIRRQAGALVRADLDSADGPLRRLSGGVVASVTVAILAMAGAGLYGLISPSGGSQSWQNSKTLIVDAQTGTRYVYLDGTLHPVVNYASALLILKSGALTATRVADSALDSVPHGAPVGIPGAPESVPAASALLAGTWSACSSPATDATGNAHPVVRVSLGAAPGGSALQSGSALLVEGISGSEFLVWNNTRLQVPSNAGYVLTVLGAAATAPVPVGGAWLNAVPRGPDLAAPGIAGLGATGVSVSGMPGASTVGDVFEVTATGAFYVAERGGLAPLTALQAQLLMAERQQGAPTPLTAAQIQGTQAASDNPAREAGLPASAPHLATPPPATTQVCAQLADAAQGTVTVSTQPATPQTLPGNPAQAVDGLGAPIADSVGVPPGGGALVRATPDPGVTTGTLYLLTDSGVKYPIANSQVLSDLGFSATPVSQVPQSLVDLVPTGPTLDDQAALMEQAANPPAATPSGLQNAG